MQKEARNFHSISIEQIIKELQSNKQGLTQAQAQTRLIKVGPNEISEKKQTPRIFVFFKQFKSLMIYILFVAAIISFFLDRIIDSYVILAVILINTIIGFVQENKAERAIKSLKSL